MGATGAQAEGDRPLPRGPHGLAREAVVASQRGRLLAAMSHAVARRGYGRTTVADVIGGAGVSRKTFYEHFADKEGCFLAAYDAAVELLLTRVREAAGPGGDQHAAARARVTAYLGTLATEPALAQTFLIEIGAAGPAALARRDDVHDLFAEMMADLAPDAPPGRRLATVGATDTLVTRWVRAGDAERLLELTDEVVAINAALLGSTD